MSVFDLNNPLTLDYLKSKGFEWDDDPLTILFYEKESRLVRKFNLLYELNGKVYSLNHNSIINVYYQWKDIGDPESPKNNLYIAYKNHIGTWSSKRYCNIVNVDEFEACMEVVNTLFQTLSNTDLRKHGII